MFSKISCFVFSFGVISLNYVFAKPIDQIFHLDGSKIYNSEGKIMDVVHDAKTFRAFHQENYSDPFYRDSKYIYTRKTDGGIYYNYDLERLSGSDTATFVSFGDGFAKDKSKIYVPPLLKGRFSSTYMPDAQIQDPNTFISTRMGYGDKNMFICNDTAGVSYVPLTGIIDTSSLIEVGKSKNSSLPRWGYSKDKNYVYYGCNILKGADSGTFQLVQENYNGLFKDQYRIYNYNGKISSGVDVSTLKFIGGRYPSIGDKNFGSGSYIVTTLGKYLDKTNIIERYYNEGFFADKNHIFLYGEGKLLKKLPLDARYTKKVLAKSQYGDSYISTFLIDKVRICNLNGVCRMRKSTKRY